MLLRVKCYISDDFVDYLCSYECHLSGLFQMIDDFDWSLSDFSYSIDDFDDYFDDDYYEWLS